MILKLSKETVEFKLDPEEEEEKDITEWCSVLETFSTDKTFLNMAAPRMIPLALTTLLNVISEQLGYAGTNNVSTDVNSEGI